MSTIDKASLIQIPSGYKNGKLYSVKPTPTYGSELVTNGDFATDSDWTKAPSGVTISGGSANFNASADSYVYQDIITVGKTYKVTFSGVITSGAFYIGENGQAVNVFTSGTYVNQEATFTVLASTRFIIRASSVPFVGSIDNVSVKEITNIGDFDFSRSSSATRVNSEGLIETASVVSTTELVTNGDFATDSDWTKQIGWSISDGVANYDFTSDAKYIRQTLLNGGFVSGKTYRINFEITEGTAYMYINSNGGGLISLNTYSVGSYSLYTTASVNGSDLLIYGRNTSGTAFSIDNVSVKEVIENDVPRLDYSDGSCASLLLEPQSTNLYLNSEPTANEGPAGNISYVGTSFGLGFNNYTYYLDNSVVRYRYGGTCAATTEYTLSVFVIMDDNSSPNVSTSSTSGDFSLVIADGFATPISVTHYGNNIYRVIAKRTSGTSGLSNNGIVKYTEQSSVGFKAVGWQLEAGSYATSYIPTSGSTVTRTADVCNNAGTSATFNSTEGVLFAEIAALANDGTNRTIALNKDTNDRIQMYFNTSTNGLSIFYKAQSGTTSFIMNETLTDATSFNKIAFKWKANDFALWVNGVETDTVSSGVTPTANSLNALEFEMFNDSSSFYGKTKQLMVFDEALSDEELSDLTGQANLSFNNLATFYNYTIL